MSRPALLAAGTELHLLVLEHDRPSCQAWTVEDDPVQERDLWLVRRRQHQDRALEVRYRYAWDAGRLDLTGYTREEKADDVLDLGENGHCERRASLSEHPGALEVGGSVWFARASECERALADALPVATTFGACTQSQDLRDDSKGDAASAGMRRFVSILEQGGALYELEPTEAGDLQCEGWSVTPARRGQGQGSIVRVERQDRTVVTTNYGYAWDPAGSVLGEGPELTFFGPSIESKGPEGTRSVGHPCALLTGVSGMDSDIVLMAGNRVYLARDACERAYQLIQARLRWLPSSGGTPAERMAALAGQGLPGC